MASGTAMPVAMILAASMARAPGGPGSFPLPREGERAG
jgi:hypothetical protein